MSAAIESTEPLTVEADEQWSLCDLIVTTCLGTLQLCVPQAAVDTAALVEWMSCVFGLTSEELLRPCGSYPVQEPAE